MKAQSPIQTLASDSGFVTPEDGSTNDTPSSINHTKVSPKEYSIQQIDLAQIGFPEFEIKFRRDRWTK